MVDRSATIGSHRPFAREAPATRLAATRIAVGIFVTVYLVGRSPVFIELGRRDADRFDPIGIFTLIDSPMVGWINHGVLVATIGLGVAFTVGWRHRWLAPLFAVGLLLLTSHRSSWGQLLHFEHLMVLQTIVLAFAPSAHAWSIDARRVPDSVSSIDRRFGWPLQVMSGIVVATYVIAGVAKLRYGGLDWIASDTLRNHIAYSFARLDVLGGRGTPLAPIIVGNSGWLPLAAALSVVIELSAPIALVSARLRNGWVAAAWLMHAGIYASMLVGFPSPLFLVGFASLFPLERFVAVVRSRIAGVARPGAIRRS